MVDLSKFRLELFGGISVHALERAMGPQDTNDDGKNDIAGDNVLKGGKVSFGGEGLIHIGNGAYLVVGGGVTYQSTKDKIDSYTPAETNEDGTVGDPEAGYLTQEEVNELAGQGISAEVGWSKDPACWTAGNDYICDTGNAGTTGGIYKDYANAPYLAGYFKIGAGGRIGQIKDNPIILTGGVDFEIRKYLEATSPFFIGNRYGENRLYGSQPLLNGFGFLFYANLDIPLHERVSLFAQVGGGPGLVNFVDAGADFESGLRFSSADFQFSGSGGFRIALGPMEQQSSKTTDQQVHIQRTLEETNPPKTETEDKRPTTAAPQPEPVTITPDSTPWSPVEDLRVESQRIISQTFDERNIMSGTVRITFNRPFQGELRIVGQNGKEKPDKDLSRGVDPNSTEIDIRFSGIHSSWTYALYEKGSGKEIGKITIKNPREIKPKFKDLNPLE